MQLPKVTPKKMTREEIMKMSTEELCAIRTPDEVEGYSTAEGRHIHDPEFDAYIMDRIGHLSTPYVDEIKAAYHDHRRDIRKTIVERFDREPPIVKMHAWGRLTSLGIEHIELVKYAHMYLANSMLRIFGVQHTQKELDEQRKIFDRYTKRR